MIDFEKACELAIKNEGEPSTIHTAWDYGVFYLFSVAPINLPDSIKYDTGTIFTAVDKSSGKVYDYDITTDLEAFENAKILL